MIKQVTHTNTCMHHNLQSSTQVVVQCYAFHYVMYATNCITELNAQLQYDIVVIPNVLQSSRYVKHFSGLRMQISDFPDCL